MHKQKTSHQQDRCEASSRDNVMKLLCIHQNLLNLNYWSGPCFSPHFRSERGRSKNSPLVSVPRSLSMFPESGSIGEFRWVPCSSSSWCAWAHTTVLLCTKACTQTVHFNIYTLTTWASQNSFPLEFQCCVSEWEGSASAVFSLSQWIFITSALSLPPAHLLSHFFFHQPITISVFEKQLRSPLATLMKGFFILCVPKCN